MKSHGEGLASIAGINIDSHDSRIKEALVVLRSREFIEIIQEYAPGLGHQRRPGAPECPTALIGVYDRLTDCQERRHITLLG